MEDDPVAASSTQLRGLKVGSIATILAVLVALRFTARSIQDASGYVLFTMGTVVLGYYSIRALIYHLLRSESPRTPILVARAKSPIWLYAGCATASAGFFLNVLFLLKIRGDKGAHPAIWGATFGCCAFGALYSWLGAYQLRITDDGIEYWSLITGYRCLESAEIAEVRIRTQQADGLSHMLEVARRSSHKQMIINLKMFPEADIKKVIDWVRRKTQALAHPETETGPMSIP
jgi:hypothetical protein